MHLLYKSHNCSYIRSRGLEANIANEKKNTITSFHLHRCIKPKSNLKKKKENKIKKLLLHTSV